ncbi:MAG: hypothetical protein O7C75_21120 [Verrucomicrobia bacterium]|nr:hypothetical protein [Verrucomicrobiota bacterium]
MHLLSLDAVAAGLVWQEVFFRQFGSSGRWDQRLILGCAIWLAYVADRLFDILSLNTQKPTTERHAYIRGHWRTMVVIWLTVFISSFILAYLRLPKLEFIGGLWITILINLYFLTLRFSGKIPTLGSLKEILTATLFTIGVSFFPLLTLPEILFQYLWLQVIFGVLCFTNVLLISHWEHWIDRGQEEHSLSQRSSNRSTLLKILLTNLIGLGLVMAFMLPGIFSLAFLISSAGICVLYLRGRGSETGKLKFLIDLPLMLPFLLFFFF